MNVPALFLLFSVFFVAALAGPTPKMDQGSLQSVVSARKGIPVHGNWCGPGHSGKTENDPCIDSTDCACKQHDICYDSMGYFNCRCDNDLVRGLNGNSAPVAIAIAAYFGASPCVGPVNVPYTKQCCTKTPLGKLCVPCGVGTRCEMIPVPVAKSTVTRYKC